MKNLTDPNVIPVFLSRRRLLALSGASLAAAALVSRESVNAQDIVTSDHSNVSDFMEFSRFATGHKNLDLAIGSALLLALEAQNNSFPSQMASLRELVSKNGYANVEALEEAIQSNPLHPVLLSVVKAWYAGVVESGTTAKVYAFEKALMYQPSRDVVVIPTYAHDGPNYWVAQPNAVEAMPEF
ncbi:sugar dehydrogenase complex small subunit [Gluconobacter wancherniae]|uniref:Dehydrogenase n=1 Tax=Gluconobacter wancherniae NBRC 103581 TaxID=656744 RepID=A0A511B4F4_9PROT|nr:sugar dehydrogenase complex small subunit [Gluconobacter wancherniae]MBF0854800.1 dehydrogenase [Gluconobacter wancherniae]GBD57871.1 2-keto-D-gluconate dehydrogenase [Gluconobacter wancherniae NBRC 103581]GBR61890.1 hypothetical protein AA103581_0032 [Gluconobacter wancherniae NBRC 103581]GEK94602.1 hypothetical protein GWA01_23720 [Gluconobacter wancherniae NBRC 103581]